MSRRIEIVALEGIGEIAAGDDLAAAIATAARGAGLEIAAEETLVISQKVVSKAEGRTARLADAKPGAQARRLAAELGKDPRLVELILRESTRVVRAERGVLLTETAGGLVCANAGIDSSNVPGEETVTLLPADPDASARAIRAAIARELGRRPAILISDSVGRPWRLGQSEVAIGAAGVAVLDDWRGESDPHGLTLAATLIAIADELAAAADLARDKLSRTPVVVVRGAGRWRTEEDGAGVAALRRPAEEDLFR